MKTVFADTGYWIALLDRQDTLHNKAVELSKTIAPCRIMTTEMVLTEVLNYFAQRGRFLRTATVAMIQKLDDNPAVEIVVQDSDLFQQGLTLYRQRPDQAWSLTDCASFCVIQQNSILEALAYDKHFEQAGFVALLRD
jgi:predicted nucleic acid-binding protein